jgi:hypothetical protein
MLTSRLPCSTVYSKVSNIGSSENHGFAASNNWQTHSSMLYSIHPPACAQLNCKQGTPYPGLINTVSTLLNPAHLTPSIPHCNSPPLTYRKDEYAYHIRCFLATSCKTLPIPDPSGTSHQVLLAPAAKPRTSRTLHPTLLLSLLSLLHTTR